MYNAKIALAKNEKLCVFHFFLIIGRPGEKGKNTGLENLQREIAILKKVDHPNVVSLYEVQ